MRLRSLDVLKFFCAIFVLLIHVSTPAKNYYLPILRCAVPCFFMLSGFFLYNADTKRITKHIKIILWIVFWSSLLGFASRLFLIWKYNFGEFDFLSKEYLKWLIFTNENPAFGHLWYLTAYLYVLVIHLFVTKLGHKCLPMFFTLGLLFGSLIVLYYYSFNYQGIITFYTRNFLFIGVPFFYLGMYIRQNKFQTIANMSKLVLFAFVLFFAVASTFEYLFLVRHNYPVNGDLLFFTPFLSFFVFLFALKYQLEKDNLLSLIGREDSLYIYIFHAMLVLPVTLYLNYMDWAHYFKWILPLFMFFMTIVFIHALRRMKIIDGNSFIVDYLKIQPKHIIICVVVSVGLVLSLFLLSHKGENDTPDSTPSTETVTQPVPTTVAQIYNGKKLSDLPVKQINNTTFDGGVFVEMVNEQPLNSSKDLHFDAQKGVELSGWALDLSAVDKLGALLVKIDDMIYKVDLNVDRQDVIDAYKLNVASTIGFRTQLTPEMLKDRPAHLYFYMLSKDCSFVYSPIEYNVIY